MSFSEKIDQLMSEGRYYFVLEDLVSELKSSLPSLRVAASRMAKKQRIKMIRGFGVIYPTIGNEPHPSYYINALMAFMGADYYVSLLTAAANWGASHQSSMVYQITSNKRLRDIEFEKTRIEFVTKTAPFCKLGIQKIAGVGGYYLVSGPELTAVDLIQAPKRGGHLNNIATVLEDLAGRWEKKTVLKLIRGSMVSTVSVQRLGYLLDVLGLDKEASYFCGELKNRDPARTLLSPSEGRQGSTKGEAQYNSKWHLYINAEVDPD